MQAKISVITGAANGIGRALALALAQRGHTVIATDIDGQHIDKLSQTKTEGEIIGRQIDVSDYTQLESLAIEAFDRFGTVDLLFNNAGIMAPGRVWEQDLAQYKKVMDINFYGVLHGVKAFLPGMMEQGSPARIVNTASIAGLVASPLFGAYNTSKHAVVSLSETLTFELEQEDSNVSVSVIAPGPVATDIMKPKSDLTVSEEVSIMMQRMDERTAKIGMSTDDLAEFILRQIDEDKFWILPHRDQLHRLTRRAQDILDGINPSFEAWTKK